MGDKRAVKLREGDKAVWQGLRILLRYYWPDDDTWTIKLELTGSERIVSTSELTAWKEPNGR